MAKTKLQKLIGFWVLIVGTLLAAACTAPLQDVNDVPINRYDGKALTMADMERSIREAAYRQGWQDVQLVEPGHFVITQHSPDRKWSATVDVLYTTTAFSIRYKDSEGLRYHPTVHTIAHTYKSIVGDLRDRIVDSAQGLDLGNQ